MAHFLVLSMLLVHHIAGWRGSDQPALAGPNIGDPLTLPLVKVVKLVVNSNAKYMQNSTWQQLFSSLEAAAFKDYKNIILVKGGSKRNVTYVDDSQNGITILETQFENYDLHGLSALYHNSDDPLVRADAYVYLLDTTTVGKTFPQKFANFSKLGFYELASPEQLPFSYKQSPSSNICAFGRGVVERYKTNFDTNVSKVDGLAFEAGSAVRGMKQLTAFADNVTELSPRVERGEPVDIYRTGFPRRVFWYPDFDVYKYICWAHFGDIQGHIVDLEPSPLQWALTTAETWWKLLLGLVALAALAFTGWIRSRQLLEMSRGEKRISDP